MSAPSIPNLLSFRGRGRTPGAPRQPRARPGRPGDPSKQENSTHDDSTHDAKIQATDADATQSRLSAVRMGYLDDVYAASLGGGGGPAASQRLPIINRGTYVRTTTVDRLVEEFLAGSDDDHSRSRQIVSLGAGMDTRYWRLRSRGRTSHLAYHELDFATQTATKLARVRANMALLGPAAGEEGQLHTETADGRLVRWGFEQPRQDPTTTVTETTPSGSGTYWCHALDLRDLAAAVAKADDAGTPVDNVLAAFVPGLRPDVPTLLLSECCLCYLDIQTADWVVRSFTSALTSVGLVLYEPLGPDDDFGRMMTRNLAARGLTMPTVAAYPDREAQRERLRRAGFVGGQRARSVAALWEAADERERAKVDALEGLDEVEEWALLGAHYGVAWGWRAAGVADEAWRAWAAS
jgi:[phosphatase 2A protein]-leucine-carboxy methyltransferase